MKVLLAVDQSRDAQVSARFLETVRLPRGTALSILHVIEIPHTAIQYGAQQHMLADWRKDAATSARRLIARIATPLKEGLLGPGLLNTVERTRADLTILGSHGYSRLMRFLLGSVSELFLNEAPCSILIVRGRPRGRQDRGLRVPLAMDFSKDAKTAA